MLNSDFSNEKYDYMMKMIIVGDPCIPSFNQGVGKSSLMLRFTTNSFTDNHEPTIGIEFNSKLMNFMDKVIKLQIWDSVDFE